MAKKIPKRVKGPNWAKMSLLYDRGIWDPNSPTSLPQPDIRPRYPHLGGDLTEYMVERFRHGLSYATYTCPLHSSLYDKETTGKGNAPVVPRIRYYVQKTRTGYRVYQDYDREFAKSFDPWPDFRRNHTRYCKMHSLGRETLSALNNIQRSDYKGLGSRLCTFVGPPYNSALQDARAMVRTRHRAGDTIRPSIIAYFKRFQGTPECLVDPDGEEHQYADQKV